MLYLISEDTISRLKAFTADGGTLVMTYISGVVNEHDLTYTGGWHPDLQAIFGVEPLETDTLYPKDRNAVSYRSQIYEMKDYATVIDVKTASVEAVYQEDFMRARQRSQAMSISRARRILSARVWRINFSVISMRV